MAAGPAPPGLRRGGDSGGRAPAAGRWVGAGQDAPSPWSAVAGRRAARVGRQGRRPGAGTPAGTTAGRREAEARGGEDSPDLAARPKDTRRGDPSARRSSRTWSPWAARQSCYRRRSARFRLSRPGPARPR